MGYILRVTLYGFLPLSMLAPLSALTVIFTIILEYIILKEDIKKLTIICLLLIFIGVVTCVLTGNIVDETYSLEILQNLFLEQKTFILSISLFSIVLCWREFLRQTTFFYSKIDDIPIAINSEIDSENENYNLDDNDIEIDNDNDNYDDNSNYKNGQKNDVNKIQNENRNNNIRNNNNNNDNTATYYYNYNLKVKDDLCISYLGLSYLVFSNAIFTGFFSVASKASIEIIKFIFLYGIKKEIFYKPGIYIIILLLPFCSFIKQKYTWYSLSLYSPLQYTPLYQAASILANSVFGLIYFQVIFCIKLFPVCSLFYFLLLFPSFVSFFHFLFSFSSSVFFSFFHLIDPSSSHLHEFFISPSYFLNFYY